MNYHWNWGIFLEQVKGGDETYLDWQITGLGWTLSVAITAWLVAQGHTVQDFGTNSGASCDYPDHGLPATVAVAEGRADRGILVCGTGIGMSIAANKVKGIRCALVHSVDTARTTAAHNNPQVIALGARIVDAATAVQMVDAWLSTPFETRHQRRLDKISAYEDTHPC